MRGGGLVGNLSTRGSVRRRQSDDAGRENVGGCPEGGGIGEVEVGPTGRG